jgi:hypothetical protein
MNYWPDPQELGIPAWYYNGQLNPGEAACDNFGDARS